MTRRKSYFLIALSNRQNLDLCLKYSLAGFTNSISGAWTFAEVQEGDYISFLYGAKAHNLYAVEHKQAIKDAEAAPPWEPVTFRQSGRTYCFPFRVYLHPVRRFQESLVRAEFAYVAENLLLRGGYRKTHFQADQTTLQAVSQMGNVWNGHIGRLEWSSLLTFVPRFTARRQNQRIPEVFQLHEFILQSLVRRYLSHSENLREFLSSMDIVDTRPEELEVLGEKAFSEGLVDILIKEAVPIGLARKIIVEVKTGAAKQQDVEQLTSYRNEIAEECVGVVLVAKRFSSSAIRSANKEQVRLATYVLTGMEVDGCYTFGDLLNRLRLGVVGTS